MPDKFDPYRESLIVETKTIWLDELAGRDPAEKQRIAQALHADPQQASHLEYIRLHTGFCRQIRVTPADLQRVGQG